MRITEGVDVDLSLNVPFGSAIFLFCFFFNHASGHDQNCESDAKDKTKWCLEHREDGRGFLRPCMRRRGKYAYARKRCVIHYPDRSDFEAGDVGNPKLRTCICYFLYFVGNARDRAP